MKARRLGVILFTLLAFSVCNSDSYTNAVACDAEPTVLTTSDGIEFVRTPDSCFAGLPDWPFAPRYVDIDGVRYAHVVDPRTGKGVTDRRVACVRGKRGIDTDPLATAGLILAEQEWRAALARVPGCRGDLGRARR